MPVIDERPERIQFTTDDGSGTITCQQQPDGTWVPSLSVSVPGCATASLALAALNQATAALPALCAADAGVQTILARLAAEDAAAAAAAAKGS